MYFEKATKFFKISTIELSYVVPVKSMVEISQNFVVFLEYMNFKALEISFALQWPKSPFWVSIRILFSQDSTYVFLEFWY